MKVGTVLDLHGRRFRLVGADAFTEQFTRERLDGAAAPQ